MFEKKFAKKVQKYYKLSEGGRGGWRIVIPTSLMAAGKNIQTNMSESKLFRFLHISFMPTLHCMHYCHPVTLKVRLM
jgi:hypothetical protein